MTLNVFFYLNVRIKLKYNKFKIKFHKKGKYNKKIQRNQVFV